MSGVVLGLLITIVLTLYILGMVGMMEFARLVIVDCSRSARMGLSTGLLETEDVRDLLLGDPETKPLTQRVDAEYCTLRTEAAVRIPKDADPAAYAPLLCAGVTVFNGIRKMGITAGDVVAIQGLGGLGHLALQYARKMGYRTVALSTSSNKKDFAEQLGATDYIDTSKEDAAAALQKMGGASLIVVTAPNPEVMGPLVSGLGPCGKLLILARELLQHYYS